MPRIEATPPRIAPTPSWLPPISLSDLVAVIPKTVTLNLAVLRMVKQPTVDKIKATIKPMLTKPASFPLPSRLRTWTTRARTNGSLPLPFALLVLNLIIPRSSL